MDDTVAALGFLIDGDSFMARILAQLAQPEALDGPEPAPSVAPPRDDQPAFPVELPQRYRLPGGQGDRLP